MIWHVTSFYRFLPIAADRLGQAREAIQTWMADRSMRGLVLLAPEGINATVAGDEGSVDDFKPFVTGLIGVDELRFKDSSSATRPFRRLSVEIREEIVGLKRPDLVPTEGSYLTPDEWHEWLRSEREMTLIDTRNRYETVAGRFRGAVDPGISHFSEWSAYLDSAEIAKDKPVLMYCTGGIRCEKAAMEMRARGFEQVYQLRDGILGYLAEHGLGEFEGECFVFDDRVTVGPDLRPTGNFGICPGCGLTASEVKECIWCGKEYFECADCAGKRVGVCCKTCLNRWQHQPKRA